MTDTIRLNKHLALQLGISRREADDLIAGGTVAINGKGAILGSRITAEDTVEVGDTNITATKELQYIALNKPVGYVCSRRRQGDAPTIYELLPSNLYHLKPVGRLDKDSSGLLLLTNDGDFAHTMTHPKFRKAKTYEVTLDKELEPPHQETIHNKGVTLEDGKSQLNLSQLFEGDRKHWKVGMHEGRNRQIRRTFEEIGYRVTGLHRVAFGRYALAAINIGEGEFTSVDII